MVLQISGWGKEIYLLSYSLLTSYHSSSFNCVLTILKLEIEAQLNYWFSFICFLREFVQRKLFRSVKLGKQDTIKPIKTWHANTCSCLLNIAELKFFSSSSRNKLFNLEIGHIFIPNVFILKSCQNNISKMILNKLLTITTAFHQKKFFLM